MDNRQKILNLIGLATKAGKTASGEFSTEKAVKGGTAHLVIVSEEASLTIRKKCSPICVLTIKFQSAISAEKMSWAMPWERRCGHLLLW